MSLSISSKPTPAEYDFFVAFYTLADHHWCWVCTLPGNNLRIPVCR